MRDQMAAICWTKVRTRWRTWGQATGIRKVFSGFPKYLYQEVA